MTYPSDNIASFCDSLKSLMQSCCAVAPGGFCQCEVPSAISFAPVRQRAHLINGIFWAVWIDQVMYYVAVDGGVPPCPREPAVYERFRRCYAFPKLYQHQTLTHASPCFLLAEWTGDNLPSLELLLEGKREFWGEVSEYLGSIGAHHVRDAALWAFSEDLRLRFEPRYRLLFP